MSKALISSVKPTPAAVLAKRARQMAAEGRDIVNFASGDVDFPPPAVAIEAAGRAARAGSVHYTNVDGDPRLKDVIAQTYSTDYGMPMSSEQIIVSTGSKQSIFNALYVTAEPGAEVLIPAPYWSSHVDMAILAGYQTRIVPCNDNATFKLQPGGLEAAITPKTRWLILCNPSSPAGAVYSADELRALGDVLIHHPQVQVLCDDLYESFVFDGCSHHLMAMSCPELAGRILTISGVSKSYAMMGWRIGWAIGNSELIGQMATLQSQVTSSPSTIGQAAATSALQAARDHRRELTRQVGANRAWAIKQIKAISGLSMAASQGSIYLLLDVSKIQENDRALCESLLNEQGLVVLPGEDCGCRSRIRINIARKLDDLTSGIDRLRSFVERMN